MLPVLITHRLNRPLCDQAARWLTHGFLLPPIQLSILQVASGWVLIHDLFYNSWRIIFHDLLLEVIRDIPAQHVILCGSASPATLGIVTLYGEALHKPRTDIIQQ